MQDHKKFATKLAVKENQVRADIKAEPKYYLTHNRECTAFRDRVMSDTDDFSRGFLFGTACSCNGAEDRILDRVEVLITREYRKDQYTVLTHQNGVTREPNILEKLREVVFSGAKVAPKEFQGFGDETITELNVSAWH